MKRIFDKIELISTLGGYQLYTADTTTMTYKFDPNDIPKCFIDSNDHVKIVAIRTPEIRDSLYGRLIEFGHVSEQKLLEKIITTVISDLENSSYLGSQLECPFSTGENSLEKGIAILRTEQESKGLVSECPDYKSLFSLAKSMDQRIHPIVCVDRNYGVITRSYGKHMPIFSIAPDALEHWITWCTNENQENQVGYVIWNLVQEKDYRDGKTQSNFDLKIRCFYDLAREGKIPAEVLEEISEETRQYKRTFVRSKVLTVSPEEANEAIQRILQGPIPQLIRKHEANLSILNYLKSRLEK